MTIEEAIRFVREKVPFEGYMDYKKSAYLNISKTVLRYLPTGSRILDFGSGSCDKTAILQVLGFKCSAYDDLQDFWHKVDGNNEKIINFTKEFGIDFRTTINGSFPFEKHSFDMLMMNDVIEHLHDSPRDILNDLLELIKPRGYLFITVPNLVNIKKRIKVLFGKSNLPNFDSYYWYPDYWRGHIREYTKDDLIKLAKHLNLEIIELKGIHKMLEKKTSHIIRPFYLTATSIFNGWRDSWLFIGRKNSDWSPRKTLSKEEMIKNYISYP
jgi:2-polyprenyl-3-methyl-5-hydroxy-6-metoxy-1,4-benzoquinol methylase